MSGAPFASNCLLGIFASALPYHCLHLRQTPRGSENIIRWTTTSNERLFCMHKDSEWSLEQARWSPRLFTIHLISQLRKDNVEHCTHLQSEFWSDPMGAVTVWRSHRRKLRPSDVRIWRGTSNSVCHHQHRPVPWELSGPMPYLLVATTKATLTVWSAVAAYRLAQFCRMF